MITAIITTVGALLGVIAGSTITNYATIRSSNITHDEERKKRYEPFIRKVLLDYIPVLGKLNNDIDKLINNKDEKEYQEDDIFIYFIKSNLEKINKFYLDEVITNAPNDLIGQFSAIQSEITSFILMVDLDVNDFHRSPENYKKMHDICDNNLKVIKAKIDSKYI